MTVRLDDPERRNAMTATMTESWGRLMAELASDRDLRALVVTGAGSAFSSGGDLGWIGAEPGAPVDRLRARMLPFYRTWLSVRELSVPTIAAVNGPAVGAGACLALACDLRYAADTAKFAVPFTRLGIHPGMAATWLLPEVVGMANARELLYTGRAVSGAEAVALGVYNRVFPATDLHSEVARIAGEIAETAPIAVKLTKEALVGAGHESFEAALRWEALAQPITMATEDLQEGLAAQREKRSPRFTGR
ncbi:enoyl-CoA hydratase-related protein [Catenulispora yoronensis]|uniref:Enoyl-CoA hydratase-related protein n=1 Tax=Catenulispora yoronensis TaxID=450799 RepID=A0ABP5GQF7_9ACTN